MSPTQCVSRNRSFAASSRASRSAPAPTPAAAFAAARALFRVRARILRLGAREAFGFLRERRANPGRRALAREFVLGVARGRLRRRRATLGATRVFFARLAEDQFARETAARAFEATTCHRGGDGAAPNRRFSCCVRGVGEFSFFAVGRDARA